MTLRQVVASFLMLLMLTPAMVCVMATCSNAAQAEKFTPCHHVSASVHSQKTEKHGAPRLAGDCLKNDLGQVSAGVDTPPPHDSFIILAVAFAAFSLMFGAAGAGGFHRGADPPPRGRPSFHRLLISQRILQ